MLNDVLWFVAPCYSHYIQQYNLLVQLFDTDRDLDHLTPLPILFSFSFMLAIFLPLMQELPKHNRLKFIPFHEGPGCCLPFAVSNLTKMYLPSLV